MTAQDDARADAALSLIVITVSDRCSAGTAEDTAGPAVAKLATEQVGVTCDEIRCVPDGVESVSNELRAVIGLDSPPSLVLTVGGTGLSPRDHTPEGTAAVIERPSPQLLELARIRCMSITPYAFVSRGIAGIAGQTLIINLPGSEKGATETLEAIADVLPYTLRLLRDPSAPRPSSVR